jgi:hypothetical protein
MLAHGFTVDFLVETHPHRGAPSAQRYSKSATATIPTVFNMVTIRSQRQAAGPPYLCIAKRAARL